MALRLDDTHAPLLLLPASICLDDNQLNASRNSHHAAHNPQTHPNARNTRHAHHVGSTGDSGEIEGAICTNSEGQLWGASPDPNPHDHAHGANFLASFIHC